MNVITYKQAQTFFGAKKNWKQRNLATKQQKRYFEWDQAKNQSVSYEKARKPVLVQAR